MVKVGIPGAASRISGKAASSANWASMESPPRSTAVRKSRKRARSLTTLWVCSTSSRVGASSSARAPPFAECLPSLHVDRHVEESRHRCYRR